MLTCPCGKEHPISSFKVGAKTFRRPSPELCDECYDRLSSEDAQKRSDDEQAARLLALGYRWSQVCPPLFRDTDPNKLPLPDIYSHAMQWDAAGGLLLKGPTGTGKTRTAYQILKHLLYQDKRVMAYDFIQFGVEATEAAYETRLSSWLTPLLSVDALLLDDLGKNAITKRVAESLFKVVSHRMEHNLATIITCNLNGGQLMKMLPPDMGPALLRRLREYCEVVVFAPGSTISPKPASRVG